LDADTFNIKTDDTGTVQSQYTRGPLSIATWAHLTNAHVFPGPSIITALQSAAASTLTALNQSVFTEISTGTPRRSLDDDTTEEGDSASITIPVPDYHHARTNSSVTAVTTISQTYEPSPPVLARSFSSGDGDIGPDDREQALQTLGPPPHARGLLLLAEMSSEGNLMTPAYTHACLSAARAHPNFVLGFISQHSLNQKPTDAFINFTPGVSLPPEGEEEEEESSKGDGLGQRWRTPAEVVCKEGADVIIVGRGILGARDRRREAERYRKEAWGAYERRIGRGGG
jgi:uridine monophosphate synthetase